MNRPPDLVSLWTSGTNPGRFLPWLRDRTSTRVRWRWLQYASWDSEGWEGRTETCIAPCQPIFFVFPSYKVSGYFAHEPEVMAGAFPELAALDWVYDGSHDLYRGGPPGVIQIWAWWNIEGGKWSLHRAAAHLGFLVGDPAVRLSGWHWNWAFWRSPHRTIWHRWFA